MSDTIVLFRGDSEKIDEFSISRTSKYSLLGRGVYLTNSKPIAATYRTKGSYARDKRNKVLFEGQAKDRKEALAKALPNFADDFFPPIPYGLNKSKRDDLRNKNIAQAKPVFDRLVDEKLIVAEYINSTFDSMLRVVNRSIPDHGYLSEFHFDRKEFNTSVIKVDGFIRDEGFWELMWDHRIQVGLVAENKAEFFRINTSTEFSLSFKTLSSRLSALLKTPTLVREGADRNAVFKRMSTVLSPYGYRGFEYSGGKYLGGSNALHRAFCMWDDEFVNLHKKRVLR